MWASFFPKKVRRQGVQDFLSLAQRAIVRKEKHKPGNDLEPGTWQVFSVMGSIHRNPGFPKEDASAV